MREIKFRVWYRTVYGFKMETPADNYQLGVYLEPNDTVVMQYTGLKDRNGKEIYEGDIVAYWQGDVREEYLSHKLVRPVEWIATTQKTGWNIAKGRGDVLNWEIIGNVWENPNLLKESK